MLPRAAALAEDVEHRRVLLGHAAGTDNLQRYHSFDRLEACVYSAAQNSDRAQCVNMR